MKVKVKRLNENACLPSKAHATDAGFDLTATSRAIDHQGNVVYGTGLALEIPDGYVGLIFPRSSICKKGIALSNAVGVIDSGYRGEVMAKFKPTTNIGNISFTGDEGLTYDKGRCDIYKVGERIAQLIIMPLPEIEIEEATDLTDSDRGKGGYGSTGK